MRLFFPIILSGLLAGCSSANVEETLEARLRLRDDRIADLESRIEKAEREADSARHESVLLRSKLVHPEAVPQTEQLAAGFAADELEIVGLLSGLMKDGHVHLVVRPIDADGDLVKLPGQLEIRILDLSHDPPRQLGRWAWSAREARELWNSAPFGKGFAIDLPVVPMNTNEDIVVQARFAVADGREFNASMPIRRAEIEQASFTGEPEVIQAGGSR